MIQGRLGANLRAYRKKHDLSQEQAAAMCQMSRTQFREIEAGTKNFMASTLARIVEGLGVDVAELFAPPRKPED